MNSQHNQEEESMDFSIIDKKSEGQALCDFSAQSVLQDKPELLPSQRQSAIIESNIFSKAAPNSATPPFSNPKNESFHKCQLASQGNYFLKDLQRMQKQLSFQSQSYCVYEQRPSNSLEAALSNKQKTISYMKITKESIDKSISKVVYRDYNYYQGQLIFDFSKKNKYPKCKRVIARHKNISQQLLCENSNLSKTKTGKDSLSKDLKSFLSLAEINYKSKPKVLSVSKSKSKNTSKTGLHHCKSHKSNLLQVQPYSLKILSEYGSSDMSLHCKRIQPNKRKELLGLKINNKCSPKHKPALFSTKQKSMLSGSGKHIK